MPPFRECWRCVYGQSFSSVLLVLGFARGNNYWARFRVWSVNLHVMVSIRTRGNKLRLQCFGVWGVWESQVVENPGGVDDCSEFPRRLHADMPELLRDSGTGHRVGNFNSSFVIMKPKFCPSLGSFCDSCSSLCSNGMTGDVP